ncbi:FtsX-like permease family protein [Spirosoma sp. HMF4905]|uniref:FtsX-like permease family protein n=1 Tax=Spirosoma arboris TaxID=2682092 RepID=A0A7K1SPA8_9BACT|nr:ABC transporter permease [Spirosoma arboris]MVM35629.1 FtsX-like permease family protein [Spirosoma arboris]
MIRNYIKIAWRTITHNKAFSSINILGLALGMGCALLIGLWVQDEYSVDSFHVNRDRLYSVYERVFSEGKVQAGHWTPGLLADELKRNVPEVNYAASFGWRVKETFKVGEKIVSMEGASAGVDFFKMFSYPLLEGNPQTALTDPTKMAISRKMAIIFFGSPHRALGKTLRYNNRKDVMVSAVFEDLPANTSEKFDYLTNWQARVDEVGWLKEWIYRSPNTYIQLQTQADPIKVEAKLKNFLQAYLHGREGDGFQVELGMQRFDEMYLHATFKEGVPDGGRIDYVRLFSLVGLFILLIACINFMNLATARSGGRAKEVGIRKTIGALRFWLGIQFMGEALLLTFLAILVAVLLVALLLPSFDSLTGKQISLPFSHPLFWISLLGLGLLTGALSGSYPALFLSSLHPINVLKSALRFSPQAQLFRRGLVVFQFVLSMLMIIGTIVVSQQVHYLQTKNLGYERENLIYTPFVGDLAAKYLVFKEQLVNMPGIQAVTCTSAPPSQISTLAYDLDWAGKNPNTKTVVVHNTVGDDFFQMLKLKLVQGRGFSPSFSTDSTAYVINESALKLTGYTDPIGKPLGLFQRRGTIIGVVRDFHLASLHDPIQPLVLMYNRHLDWGDVLIKTKPGQTRQALASLERVYKQLEPQFPFTYQFVDEEYQKLYQSEQIVRQLTNLFALLTIFIACLGLLGLASFTAQQRTKEIGVRKVLGASVASVVALLAGDFLKLVVVAIILAIPLAWYAMSQWLQGFAYRIEISGWVFVLAGLLAIGVALLTIGFQSIKAALLDPVKSLRSE